MGHEYEAERTAERARWEAERRPLERSARRAKAILGIMAVLLLVSAVWAILLGIGPRDREYAQFMRECTQDREHYECAARWHAGGPSTVPVAVPVTSTQNHGTAKQGLRRFWWTTLVVQMKGRASRL